MAQPFALERRVLVLDGDTSGGGVLRDALVSQSPDIAVDEVYGREPAVAALERVADDGAPYSVAFVDDSVSGGGEDALAARLEPSLRSLVEHLPDAIVVHRRGTIDYANPAMVDFLGCAGASDLVGRPLADVVQREDYALIAGYARQRAGAGRGEPARLPRARLVRLDGQVVTAEAVLLSTVFDAEPASALVVRDVAEILTLRHPPSDERGFRGMVGSDPQVRDIYELTRQAAPTQASILITGETGTGKEILAHAIHMESGRAGAPFVPVNCAALPEGLIESELFGHVRGAFSGAVRDKRGRFESADGGTILLDEIGELDAPLQVKLLRALQEGSIQRVGGEEPIPIDVRVIAATNRDLRQAIARGAFREDLFFRLCVVPIHLPPLRERPRDIPILAEHFLSCAARATGRRTPELSPAACRALLEWRWPGNVRELKNAIEYALVRAQGGRIQVSDLPADVGRTSLRVRARSGRRRKLTRGEVEVALRTTGGNKAKAARMLGVGRPTLYRYLADSPSHHGT